jgi:hypothetical protein
MSIWAAELAQAWAWALVYLGLAGLCLSLAGFVLILTVRLLKHKA